MLKQKNSLNLKSVLLLIHNKNQHNCTNTHNYEKRKAYIKICLLFTPKNIIFLSPKKENLRHNLEQKPQTQRFDSLASIK